MKKPVANHINCRYVTLILFFVVLHFTAFSQLKADFSASVTSGCTPLVEVQFQDLSTGSPTQWEWDLGNGTISPKKSPTATYINPGTYTVKLIVKNAGGTDSVTKTNYITVYSKPVVNFSATPLSGCIPLNVNFTDLSTTESGTIQSWIWDFGDGISSTSPTPSHTYNLSDTFNVTLLVTTNFGCTQAILKTAYIAIADTVNADFTYTYSNICNPPVTIDFSNMSGSGSSLKYKWSFGDGINSGETNPSHIYTNPGNYDITLITANESGCTDTIVKSISVGVAQANFIVPAIACLNEAIPMQDSSIPVAVSGTWDFGDGTVATGLNVFHTYTQPGTYDISYNADFDGCSSSIKKSISVTEKPVASFTSPSVITACKAPLTIDFVNTSSGASAYTWNFGDGTTSTEINPSHTYTKAGTFTVTLTAFTTVGGCSDSAVQTGFVKINVPTILGFTDLPFSGCAPAIINFNPSIFSPDSIVSYKWSFGDGSTSTEAAPVYTYNVPGNYTVMLTIITTGGCTDTFELAPAVVASQRPVPGFTATPLNACASDEIQFTDTSLGSVSMWHWDFGDGGTSNEKNPLHHFQDTGHFTITLTVTNNGCSDSIIVPNYIFIQPPVAAFASTLDCSQKFLRTFDDQSIAPESWNWDFGDGDTSTQRNPAHTYINTGIYNVQLIVTNGACADTTISPVYIIDETPQINITALHSNFCKLDSLQFTTINYNSTYITNFKWDFGDGDSTTFSHAYNEIVHKYQLAGSYTPVLVTTDLNGCDDTTQASTALNIYGPTANFSNIEGTCKDSLVVFNDSSFTDGTHNITKWVWDYGDGITDTLTEPPFQHYYSTAVFYTVKLIVQDSNGCTDTLLKPNALVITNPLADFNLPDSIRCSTSHIVFNNASRGVGLLYHWDFGDGSSSTIQNPLHLYSTEGNYQVSLSVEDRFGCTDTIVKPGVVTISNPVAAFTISDSSATCPPLPVQVTNISTGYSSAFWDFGDGNSSTQDAPFHFYTTPGRYSLTLIAHGYGECFDTAFRVINLKGPNGTFKYTPLSDCFPSEVSFNAVTENTSQYTWDFGDGVTKVTTTDSVKYNYKLPGAFVPKLIIEDRTGCKVALENNDTIRVLGVYPHFSIQSETGCDSTLAVFTDSSVVSDFDAIKKRTWVFGDGTQSKDLNPFHYYTSPGIYYVTLSMTTDSGCFRKDSLPLTVNINKAPVISAAIPVALCVNSDGNFAAQDTSNISDSLTWSWNFGNGDLSNQQNTIYSYTNAGNYNVSVITTAITGCADTAIKSITINPLPPVDAGPDSSLCRFKSITLQPSGAANYVWMVSPSLNCSACTNPVAKPDSTTTYYVTGTDNFGCQASDSVNVVVYQPVIVSPSVTGDTLCLGSSVQLNASGATYYNWQPSEGLSSTTIPNPVAAPNTTTVYTLIGSSDSKQCFTDTATVSILVAPIPTFDIADTLVSLSVGSSYQLKTISSPDVVQWLWLPPAYLSCSNCAQPLVAPKTNITYTATASTIFGCSATDNIRFEVLCNDANVFIPNTFSPNTDGKNDYFYPRGKGLFTIKSMKVFNRWGALVFVKNNFAPENEKEGWNGTYNNTLQPSDVYVYIIDILCENGTVLSYKGNVTLIR